MNLDYDILRQLNDIADEEFIDASDREIFEYYASHPSALLMEMASVRGKDVQPEPLPFSFYFSSKGAVHQQHGIRVKIKWIDNKINSSDADGFFILHGGQPYEYVIGSHKYKPTGKELSSTREFLEKHKVLFAAVWEEKLYDGELQDYFKGNINFKQLLSKFENITEKQYYNINHCNDISQLESVVRKYKIFNMND